MLSLTETIKHGSVEPSNLREKAPHQGYRAEVAPGHRPAAPRTIWSARLQAEIPALYAAGRLTVSDIAELLNITPATVAKHLSGTTARERRRHDVHVLHRHRWVRAAIADELGISDRLVGRYLRELDEQNG